MAKATDNSGREQTRRRANELPIDYHGNNFTTNADYRKQYLKNMGKASRETQQKRMREYADDVEAGYKRAKKAPSGTTGRKAASRKTSPIKRRRSAPSMTVGGKGKLANLRAAKEKEPEGKIDMGESRKVDVPASKRPQVKLDTREARTPERKSKLRRAVSAVGHGIAKAARAYGRSFKDDQRKAPQAKRA